MKIRAIQYYVVRVYNSNIDRIGREADAEIIHGPFCTYSEAEEAQYAHRWSAHKMTIASNTVELNIIGEN